MQLYQGVTRINGSLELPEFRLGRLVLGVRRTFILQCPLGSVTTRFRTAAPKNQQPQCGCAAENRSRKT